ncbi:MAG: DUF4266 domain-containing protein [bacterium]|nr:DUF4266 domain-containing protein [bacterium]
MKYITILSAILILSTPAMAQNNDNANQKAKMPPKTELSFYEKRYLNDPIMQFESDRLRTKVDQHIYQIKEGSRGGYDSAGGACGCN